MRHQEFPCRSDPQKLHCRPHPHHPSKPPQRRSHPAQLNLLQQLLVQPNARLQPPILLRPLLSQRVKFHSSPFILCFILLIFVTTSVSEIPSVAPISP